MPFEITQDGIADSVKISRGHAAVSLTKLKEKELVTEKLSKVKNTKRQRKVYFLTGYGRVTVGDFIRTFNKRTIMLKDIEGNEFEIKIAQLSPYLIPFTKRIVLPLEIIKHLSEENIFDTKTFLDKLNIKIIDEKEDKPVKVKKDTRSKVEKNETLSSSQLSTEDIPEIDSQSFSSTPLSLPYLYNNPLYRNSVDNYNLLYYPINDENNQIQPVPHLQNKESDTVKSRYIVPNSHGYYYNPSYHYSFLRISSYNERQQKIISDIISYFSIGIMLASIGLFYSFYFSYYGIDLCFTLLLANFGLNFLIGFIGGVIGFRNLPYIGNKGRRILLLMGSIFVFTNLLSAEIMFLHLPYFLEMKSALPMFLIFLTVPVLLIMEKPLKTKHKIELANSLGIFSILMGIFSFSLLQIYFGPNPFVYSPLWIMFGFLLLMAGYELHKTYKNKSWDNIKKYLSAGTGLFLFIILLYKINYNYSNALNFNLNFLPYLLWGFLGVYLISVRYVRAPRDKIMLETVSLTVPIAFISLFFLFGFYLLLLGRIFEGIIEFIVALVILRLSSNKIKEQRNSENILHFFIFLLLSVTAVSLTFYNAIFLFTY